MQVTARHRWPEGTRAGPGGGGSPARRCLAGPAAAQRRLGGGSFPASGPGARAPRAPLTALTWLPRLPHRPQTREQRRRRRRAPAGVLCSTSAPAAGSGGRERGRLRGGAGHRAHSSSQSAQSKWPVRGGERVRGGARALWGGARALLLCGPLAVGSPGASGSAVT